MAIQFNGSYSENFDTLASSGTSSLLPLGWALLETGTNANTQYTAGTGSSNTGDIYSFGAAGSTERALGTLRSGSLIPTIGVNFTNTTGSTITTLNVSYRGEQWRLGTADRATADRLDFQYSLDATSLATGTWVDVNTLDFSSPVTNQAAGLRDGNINNTTVPGNITGLNIPNGATFWFRWSDFDVSGSDDGLAIDNFSLSTTVTPPTGPTVAIAATDANAAETGTDSGNFRITRTGDTTNALSVSYTVAAGAGQATNGTDYTPNLTGTATIPAGQPFVDITITPVDDLLGEGNETVTLTLASSANYTLGTATATVAIADNDVAVAPGNIRIHDIQGARHISPLLASATGTAPVTNVPGIVTAIASNGFYLQDPNPDNNDATSEGIFVFTGSTSPILSARTVGEAVLVTGTVSEFRAGNNNPDNLTLTQISSNNNVQTLSVAAWTTAPTTITPTVLGNGGRTIPTTVISNDQVGNNVENPGTLFDPAQDGIDFYESLEGMLVQVNNPVTTSPTNGFGEIWVLADNGVNATSRTARGGSLITESDFNPERIQIDNLNNSVVLPTVNVGAQLSTVTGVVNYDFNSYEVLVSTAPTVVQASTLQREVSNLTPLPNQLTLATFNVENLDPNDTIFNNLANRIVNNLRSPDIINLEEIQDNNGPINDSVVDANVTLQTLINAIADAGGPTYQYRQINPVDDTNGGEPGGNIRVAFLFNPQRVSFVDRPGGTPTSSTTVTDVGSDGIPDLSASPGLIDPNNAAFNSSRKPLVGEFLFNGQTVYVIGNHFNSKGGDDPLFGPTQPPVLSSEVQRNQQATIVRNFVQNILTINPNANVVVAGDLNDFEFSNPLTTLENGGLNTLIETLPANERYTYNFEGNAQTLDQILVSNNLFSRLNGFDAVHINSEFADQDSDHDPVLARFNLINVTNGTSGRDTLVGTAFGDRISGGLGGDILTGGVGNDEFVYTNIREVGDRITDFTPGSDTIVLTQLLDSLVPGGYNGSNAIADGYVQLIQGSTANSTTLQIDQDGPLGSGIFRPFIDFDNVSVVALNNVNNFVF